MEPAVIKSLVIFRNILVGDIWILAGQSNMFGIALPEEPLLLCRF
jgi:hypothetical protein